MSMETTTTYWEDTFRTWGYPRFAGDHYRHQVEEAIIALESSEHENIGKVINELEDTPVIVRIIPDMYDILSGSVKMNAIFGGR